MAEITVGGGVMKRLTEKHYLGADHYMKCSENCDLDMDCIDCPSFERLVERLAERKSRRNRAKPHASCGFGELCSV